MAFNLRNTAIDKRRLSAEDRETYRGAAREKAIKRVNQNRGKLAWGVPKPLKAPAGD